MLYPSRRQRCAAARRAAPSGSVDNLLYFLLEDQPANPVQK